MGEKIKRVLVTGARGQIGSELTPKLREIYGKENVLASDIRQINNESWEPYEVLDVTNRERLRVLVEDYDLDSIVHLAAILSAMGEMRPKLAWNVNINGLINVLDIAKEKNLNKVFHPSSIASFGPETPRDMTPQDTIQKPRTIYGITKVVGELIGTYFFERDGVDVRGARFPGIISNVAPPGGGTTDYATEIFYKAVKRIKYTCFLQEDTILPMMYMPDCLKGIVELLNVDIDKLKHHCDFNLAAFSFSPRELAEEIKIHLPKFEIEYRPDYRQKIADSWPRSIDDSSARQEWGWSNKYDLPMMVEDMLKILGERHNRGEL